MSLNSHLFFMHIPCISSIHYKQNQLAVREKNHIIKTFSTALFSPLSSKCEITLCLSVNLLLRVKCKQHPHSCLISNVQKMPSPWRLTCYDSTPKARDWPTAGGSAMCFCLNKPAGTCRGEWMCEAPQTHTHTHTLWAGLICWHNDSLRALGADTWKEMLPDWSVCAYCVWK